MTKKIQNKLSFISFLIFSILVVFNFNSCKHTIEENPSESFKYTILNIDLKSVKSKIQRQALPVIDDEIIDKLVFEVVAKDENGRNSSNYSDEDFFTRLRNEEDESIFTYKIKLSPGKWDITLNGKIDGNTILTGNKQITVKTNGSYQDNIYVNFIDKSSGNVDLLIDVTNAPNIEKLTIKDSGSSSLNGDYFVSDENGKRLIRIKPDSTVTSGEYNPILCFSDNIDSDAVPFFSYPEHIVVRQNMTTKYWIKSSNNPFLSNPDEKGFSNFIVSSALISELKNTVFYVGYDTGNDSKNSGVDYSSPLKTISKAFDYINESNKNDYHNGIQKDYIIFLLTTTTEGKSVTFSTLEADNPLNLTIMSIDSNSPVTLGAGTIGKNITLHLANVIMGGNLTTNSTSNVTVKNSILSKNIIVGEDPTDLTIEHLEEASKLSLTDCTVEGTVSCYGTKTNKCDLTAKNTTFNKTCTFSGNFTGNNCNFGNQLSLSSKSIFILNKDSDNDSSTEQNYITNRITVSDNSSLHIENTKIGEGVTATSSIVLSKNSINHSSVYLKNSIITKNLDASYEDFDGNITFAGDTRFDCDVADSDCYSLQLGKNAKFYVENITPITTSDTTKFAAIEASEVSSKMIIISPIEGTEFSEDQLKRFELHNDGYYLAFDNETKKGIVKLSSILIEEPLFDGCTLTVSGGVSFGDSKIGVIAKSDTPEILTAIARDKNGTSLEITEIKQYYGKKLIAESTESNKNKISFVRSEAGTYTLTVKYIYNGLEFDSSFQIKVS